MVGHPDGREDVGLWLGERLLRLCTSVEEGFSLKNFHEYAAYMDPAVITMSMTQVVCPLSHPQMNMYASLKPLNFHTYILF